MFENKLAIWVRTSKGIDCIFPLFSSHDIISYHVPEITVWMNQ